MDGYIFNTYKWIAMNDTARTTDNSSLDGDRRNASGQNASTYYTPTLNPGGSSSAQAPNVKFTTTT